MAVGQYSNSDKDWLLEYMDEYADVLDTSDAENAGQSPRDLLSREDIMPQEDYMQEDSLLNDLEDQFLAKAQEKAHNSQEFQKKFREPY